MGNLNSITSIRPTCHIFERYAQREGRKHNIKYDDNEIQKQSMDSVWFIVFIMLYLDSRHIKCEYWKSLLGTAINCIHFTHITYSELGEKHYD